MGHDRPEDPLDFAADRVDLGHPINAAQDAAVSKIGQDRRRLAMIDIEPRPDRLRSVVRSAGEFTSTASIADAVDLGPVVAFVIAGATLLTAKTSSEPID